MKLSLRQAFDAFQIGIRQICAVELCQAQIRAAQIGTPQRRPDQERTTKPGITEVGSVQPCMTKSGATQVRLAEVGPGEHGGIELSAAHVGFTQAGASQHLRWPSARTPYPPWRDRRFRGWPKRGSPHLDAPGINPHGRSTPALQWRRRDETSIRRYLGTP